MKKIILAITAATLMSGAAFATSASGIVAKINSGARVITLESGASYTIPRDVAMPPLQVGDKVSLQLNSDGDKVVTVLR